MILCPLCCAKLRTKLREQQGSCCGTFTECLDDFTSKVLKRCRNGSKWMVLGRGETRNHVILLLNHIESSNGIGFNIGSDTSVGFQFVCPIQVVIPIPKAWRRLCCCSCMCRGPPMNGDPRCVCCCIDLCGSLVEKACNCRRSWQPGRICPGVSFLVCSGSFFLPAQAAIY